MSVSDGPSGRPGVDHVLQGLVFSCPTMTERPLVTATAPHDLLRPQINGPEGKVRLASGSGPRGDTVSPLPDPGGCKSEDLCCCFFEICLAF